MLTKRALAIAALLLFANTSITAQSNQLRQLASQLSSEATNFADSSYNDYSRSFRFASGDVEAVMSAHQFSAGAQLFNRMVNDRRRNQELREAFQSLQNSSRSAERNNLQRNRWYEIQRLMSDISRELNLDSSDTGPIPGPIPIPLPWPDQGGPYQRSGQMTWRGRVDDDVRIVIRGVTAEVETIGGSPYYDATSSFTTSLPPRRVSLRLQKRRGRGDVFIEQQPSRENGYAAVVRILDKKGGASDYEFELSWDSVQ